MMKYVAWHKNTTGGTCPYVWTPLSDKNFEGLFLNMNDNSSVQYQMWDKSQPNGGENDNCSIFFEDADKSFLTDRGIDKVTIAEKLTYG